jgi:hypothetical protein
MSTRYEELNQEAARVRAQYSSDNGSAPTGSTASHDPTAQERHYFRLSNRLLSPKGLQDLPPPEPLIDDILMLDSLAVCFGKPGSCKSFLSIDWALSVATGSWWHGRAVAAGPVLYVIGEAASGFSQRQAAWATANRVHSLEDFDMHWLPEPINLLDPAQVAALVQVAKELQPKLVVFDTLARCMAGGDENGPRDMGLVVDGADQLRRATGACVLFVHHTPKDGSKPRGHSALEGAVSTSIEVRRDGARVNVSCDKQKDAEEFESITLVRQAVGDSCTLNSPTGESHVDSHHNRSRVLGTLRDCFSGTGCTTSEWRDALGDMSKTTFYRTRNALVEEGEAVNYGTPKSPRYWPLGCGPSSE